MDQMHSGNGPHEMAEIGMEIVTVIKEIPLRRVPPGQGKCLVGVM